VYAKILVGTALAVPLAKLKGDTNMEKHNQDQVRAALASVKRIQRSIEYMGENVEIDWRSNLGLDRSLADFSRLVYDAEQAVKALEKHLLLKGDN
tara:strand:+ start:138 stop:422 length:285 start_codon:yes stop_codon:yes gene_type:complete